MSTYTKNLNLFKYDTSKDSNVAFSITKALNNNWDIIDAKCGQGNNILDFKWSDHILNDQSWLRADTFSWQNGTTYSLVYNELLSEYNNSASTTKKDGSITYKRTPKGYKIALANQETAILNKYNSDGIAWYYILDTTNKKFKLPRTKYGFEGVRGKVGDDIAESLPNIKGTLYNPTANGASSSYFNFSGGEGAFSLEKHLEGRDGYTNSYNNSGYSRASFNASRSSSTYQDGAAVQERATQMYLYFYVGGFTKSAEAQTAGLKAELLNGKVDTSSLVECVVIIDSYVNGSSGYNIYSNGYCEQWIATDLAKGTSGTVTFLKPFKAKPQVIMSIITSRASSSYDKELYPNAVTNTGFTYSNVTGNGGISWGWRAYGYLA